MIERGAVERYLRANGIHPDAPEEQIKEVLFSAKWHQDDVETALTVLREDPRTHERHVDQLHQVFHSDDRLEPETISALLGIETEIKPRTVREQKKSVGAQTVISMVVVAGLFSFAWLVSVMWFFKLGPFFQM